MTFKEALILAHDCEKLIGKKYNGETIDEILIVPTDKVMHDNFFREYRYTMDAQVSILPFVNCDVEVVALFKKKYFIQENLILATNVYNILNPQ